jgi:hypothetical protein
MVVVVIGDMIIVVVELGRGVDGISSQDGSHRLLPTTGYYSDFRRTTTPKVLGSEGERRVSSTVMVDMREARR